jgi:tRNA A37 N6-isopentenylltransferase MiaA
MAFVIGLTAPLPVLYARIDAHLKERIHAGMKVVPVNEHAIARKQMTWFKKQKDIHWFDISRESYQDEIASVVRAWYNEGNHVPED